MSSQDLDQARRAGRALDAANFFLADVRDGLGPYLAVYLLTEQHWNEARIGLVMSIATIAGIVAQTPAGALVDATRTKRLVMVAAAILVTLASLSLPLFPNLLPVMISQGIAQAAAVVFPPASPRSLLAFSGMPHLPGASGVTRLSTTQATPSRRASPASPPIGSDRPSCSTFSAPWRSRASSASWRSPNGPSTTTSRADCTTLVLMVHPNIPRASACS